MLLQKTPDNPYDWAPRTITGILESRNTFGHMVNFKTRKQSYRSKRNSKPTPTKLDFREHPEAIIDEENLCPCAGASQEQTQTRQNSKTNMFSGLVRCADCGEKLYYCTSASLNQTRPLRMLHFP